MDESEIPFARAIDRAKKYVVSSTLTDAALERLYDYADAQTCDVVVGREMGIGRDLPARIFPAGCA